MRLRPLVLMLAVGACHQPTTPDPALRTALVHRADLDQAQMQALAAHWGDSGFQRQLAATLLTNATWLDSVVTRRGWPGFATADSDGAAAAYLIAQHADALPEAQARFLEALRLAVHRGDARLVDLAFLEDRVRKAQGRPQLYGTQPAYDSTGRALQPAVEAPDSLDARRATVGLPPMAAYLDQLRAMNARLRATADSGAAH